jgi:hypothetical protein
MPWRLERKHLSDETKEFISPMEDLGQGRRSWTSWREQWVSRGFEYGKVGARGDAVKGMAGSQVLCTEYGVAQ